MELKDWLIEPCGCEFCASFDFNTKKIILKKKLDLRNYSVNGQLMAYCPLCGRKIEED